MAGSMALTQALTNLPHFNREDWDTTSGMGGSLFVGEMGQMAVGVDTSDREKKYGLPTRSLSGLRGQVLSVARPCGG
jgi:hypothetical protein